MPTHAPKLVRSVLTRVQGLGRGRQSVSGMLKNLICKVVRLGFSGPNIIPRAGNLPNPRVESNDVSEPQTQCLELVGPRVTGNPAAMGFLPVCRLHRHWADILRLWDSESDLTLTKVRFTGAGLFGGWPMSSTASRSLEGTHPLEKLKPLVEKLVADAG
jgi:hypothetical protein